MPLEIKHGSTHDWPDAKWQAIFMTADGHDYCRATIGACGDVNAAERLAQSLFDRTADATARRVVTAVLLEKW